MGRKIKMLKGPPMVMKDRDTDRRLNLLLAWRGSCVLCGRGFSSIDSVTLEHLQPRCMGGKRAHNLAPSHHVCNSLRGKLSLVEAASRMESTLCEIAVRHGRSGVERFLATPVPHRIVDEKHAVRFKMQARSIAPAV